MQLLVGCPDTPIHIVPLLVERCAPKQGLKVLWQLQPVGNTVANLKGLASLGAQPEKHLQQQPAICEYRHTAEHTSTGIAIALALQ
jgi:hypothetical protein